MALPSLDVAPVRNTSPALAGISFKMTAAVKVLPWTIRTFRFGCLLTNNVPPPLSASFCREKVLGEGSCKTSKQLKRELVS